MSEPAQKHIDKIRAELKEMSEDGHLDEFDASTAAGAVQHELSKLEEALKEANK